MDNIVSQKVQFEIGQIDELINESAPLFELCKKREPDFVERCGIALILQSFYSGIEKIMLLIIKNKDANLPNGIKWHKELLESAFVETENRTRIFTEEIRVPIIDYLQFRHLARHSYGFQLKWEKMQPLLFDMNLIWENIKKDIDVFLKNN